MGTQRQALANRNTIDLLPVLEREDEELKARVKGASRLLLFLDFDGTLAPIVQMPMLAVMPAATRELLKELAEDETVTIAIVSGRGLRDVRERVGLPTLIYAGNHGLEIEGRGLAFEHPDAAALKVAVREITERIAERVASLEGIVIESKGLTSSIHYRRAPRSTQIDLEAVLRDMIAADDPNLEVRQGKMVHEIRPSVAWDKGKAVAWIRKQLGQRGELPIVIGDDTTDEDAFDAFDDAISVCVDPQRTTAAKYRAESPGDVLAFLLWLTRVWKRADSKK